MAARAASAPQRGAMTRRIAVGALLAALGIGCVLDARAFALLVLVIALRSLWEARWLSARKGQELVFPVAACAVALYIALAYFGLLHHWEPALDAFTLISARSPSRCSARAALLRAQRVHAARRSLHR